MYGYEAEGQVDVYKEFGTLNYCADCHEQVRVLELRTDQYGDPRREKRRRSKVFQVLEQRQAGRMLGA
jgi:hypothetical protein